MWKFKRKKNKKAEWKSLFLVQFYAKLAVISPEWMWRSAAQFYCFTLKIAPFSTETVGNNIYWVTGGNLMLPCFSHASYPVLQFLGWWRLTLPLPKRLAISTCWRQFFTVWFWPSGYSILIYFFFFFWKYLLSCIRRKLDFTLLLDSRWQSHLLSSSNWLSFFLQNLLALGQIMHPRFYCVSPQSSVTCLWNKFPTVSLQAASFLYRKFDKNEWKSVFLLPKLSHSLWRECIALHFIMPKVVANEFSTSTWALNPQFYH